MTLHRLTKLPSSSLLSMPWRVISIDGNGKSIKVLFATGEGGPSATTRNVGYWLHETKTSVELMLVSRSTAKNGDSVAASIGYGAGTVTLNDALGRRSLLHPPVSKSWALRLP